MKSISGSCVLKGTTLIICIRNRILCLLTGLLCRPLQVALKRKMTAGKRCIHPLLIPHATNENSMRLLINGISQGDYYVPDCTDGLHLYSHAPP